MRKGPSVSTKTLGDNRNQRMHELTGKMLKGYTKTKKND